MLEVHEPPTRQRASEERGQAAQAFDRRAETAPSNDAQGFRRVAQEGVHEARPEIHLGAPPPRDRASPYRPILVTLVCDDSRSFWIRTKLRPLAGDLAAGNCGHQPCPRLASRSADSGERRLRGRRRDCRERRAGRGRAHDGRHRRRPVRSLLGRRDQGAVGLERIRTRAVRPLAGFPRGPRRDHHAAGRNSRRHRPRRCRWLGATAQAIRKSAVGSPVRIRHRVCGSRLPGHRSDRRTMDLADFLRTLAEPRRVLASLSARRKAAERRRALSQSRPRCRLQQPGRLRIANLLRRRDRRRHSQDVQEPGRDDECRRSVGVLSRVGRAHFDRLPRLARLRITAERAGHGRARNAEHHGNVAGSRPTARRTPPNCTSASRP